MKIVIGADHRGREALTGLQALAELTEHHVQVLADACPNEHTRSCDYPDMAYPVARVVADGDADYGILLCGTGIGMSIAANKVPGVRAALVHDEMSAELARRHNDANVLCLAADLLGFTVIDRIIRAFLNTPFDGGRHLRRKLKIAAIERGDDPRSVTQDNESTADPGRVPV